MFLVQRVSSWGCWAAGIRQPFRLMESGFRLSTQHQRWILSFELEGHVNDACDIGLWDNNCDVGFWHFKCDVVRFLKLISLYKAPPIRWRTSPLTNSQSHGWSPTSRGGMWGTRQPIRYEGFDLLPFRLLYFCLYLVCICMLENQEEIWVQSK